MSVIYPGNYVARLNAYRNQACEALPGVDFYQLVGVAIVDADVAAGATYDLEILSPDLRPDDKPRLDKPFVIPQGAGVYRTAIRAINLEGTASDTITINGVTPATAETAPASGKYGAGNVSAFDGLSSITREGSDATVAAVASAGLTITNTKDTAMIIVEVDYFMDHAAPKADDCNIPFKVEAGQGT